MLWTMPRRSGPIACAPFRAPQWSLLCFPLLACWCSASHADTEQAADDAQWLDGIAERPAAAVNEGQLHFLARLPDKPVHHHRNEIVISEDSLGNGWVELRQCHHHLDAVGRSQIVFHREHTRALRILETWAIDESWVEGHTIQLSGTGSGAHICLAAESRALSIQPDGTYLLRNGPYLRRFLDGYYPIRVSMRVTLRVGSVRFLGSTPAPQVGFKVWQTGNEVHYDAQFEGRLTTQLRFVRETE